MRFNTFALFAISVLLTTLGTAFAAEWTPPPAPEIPPLIGKTYPEDADQNGIADGLETKLSSAQAALKSATAAEARTAAQEALDVLIEVQLVFTAPVTQEQIDAFLAAGGEITYMYQSVSYGWNGRIPLKKASELPGLMGKNFVHVKETRRAKLHLDTATRTGRVRPVWAAGFAGNASGFDGDSTITIAILDTGVDVSHTDLAGRQQYWRDFTSDGNASALDLGGHGSHVSGIALGTGASAGAATGTVSVTDNGDLTGVANGSFFPAPLDLPTTSITYSSTARWLGGGSTSLYQVYNTKGASAWTALSAATAGTSPVTEANTLTALATRAYCPALLSTGGTTVTQYVITSTIPSYPAVGDGFNKLRGVAPGCNWAGAKVFTNAGSGLMTYVDSALDAMVTNRVANNIKVLNMSLGVDGTPGLDTTSRQKVNTAVNNGIVVCCSAGNDGGASPVDDPGRAAMAITVGASDDNNQVTDYTSEGFTGPSTTSGQEEDYKPDILAPGGSAGYYTDILSIDSNGNDGDGGFTDQQANDYTNMQGTSMASPFAAGCAALIIDAMQQQGTTWDFTSSQHTRYVKMLLCATATETNANRDSAAYNPTLQRAAAPGNGYPVSKDIYEGYGILNTDAAIEAVSLAYTQGAAPTITLGPATTDRRAWARKVSLYSGWTFNPSLTVPGTGDFDMYLYSNTPGTYGAPAILASSTNATAGTAESLTYTPASNMTAILVIKRVSGYGTATLSSTGDTTAPTVTISAPSATMTKAGPITYTVTYADTQSGVASVSLASGNITLNTTGTATATIGVSGTGNTRTVTLSSITGNGTLGISIAAGTAMDNFGNSAAAAGPSTTFIVDNTAPTVTISAPSATMTKAGPITYTVTYADTQSGIASVSLLAGNVTLNTTGTAAATIGVSGTGNTRTVTLSSITGNGTLGISIAAGTATDNVGNTAPAAGPSTTFIVDNTAPTVTISAPSATMTKAGPITYTVTYADTQSGIASVSLASGNITLNTTGTATATIGVSGSGNTRTVTLSAITGDGTLGISIAAGTATDNVGNTAPAAGPSATFTIDNTGPSVTISAPSATVTKAGPITYTVTYADALSGIASVSLLAGNVTLNTTGTATATIAVTGTGNARTVTLSAITGDGTLGISIAAGTATDNVGNTAPAAGPSTTFTVDNTAPTVTIGAPSATVTKGGPITYTVTYADALSGIASISLLAGNVTLNTTGTANATIGVTGTGNTRTVTLSSITGNGTLGISIAAATATDNAGNTAPTAGPSTTFTVDNTAPTVTIGAPSATVTKGGPITYTVTYADALSGIATVSLIDTNVTLNTTGTANATIAVTGTGNTRTVTLSSITGNGTLGISIAAATATDNAGNTAPTAGPSTTFTVDNTAPTVTIGAPSATVTKAGPITYTVTYADALSGIATVSLIDTNVTLNTTGTATATIAVTGTGNARTVTLSSITGDGTLGISIAAGTATDNVGNTAPAAGPSTTFTVDNTAPTVTLSAPSGTVTKGGPITYTVTYADALSGIASVSLIDTNVTLNTTGTATATIAVTGTGNTRTVTLSSITGNGTLGISIAAATATDNAGNTAPTAGPSTTFTVDNNAPTVGISAPSATVTKGGPITYTVTYADALSGIASVSLIDTNVTLNTTGTATATIGVSGSGNTRTVTLSSITGNGTLGISIAAGTATDNAGNAAPAAGPSTTFTVDNTAPTVTLSAPSATVTKGGPITYTVTYADALSGIASVSLIDTNVTLNTTGTATATIGVSGSGNTRTVTLSSITGNGTLGISIAAATATDNAGNTAPAAGPSTTFTVDNTAPTVGIGAPSSTLTKAGPITYTVTYADALSGMAAVSLIDTNVTLDTTGTANATIAVTGTGNTRTVTLSSITGNGTLGISIAAATATDNAGNTAPTAGPSTTFMVDNTAPTVTLSAPSATVTKGGPITYTVTYADALSGMAAVSLIDTNVTLDTTGTANATIAVTGTGNTRTVTLSSITGNGTLGISIAADTATDNAGNSAPAASPSTTFMVDNTAPTVTLSAPSALLTKAGPITYTVTYADALSGMAAVSLIDTNVTLNTTGTANATIAVTGTGNTRTVTLSSITGNGTLGISIAAGTATDNAGNSAPAAGPSTTFMVDNTAPTVTLSAPSAPLTTAGPITYTVTYADALSGMAAVSLIDTNVTLNTTSTATATIAVSGTGNTRTVTLSSITGNGTLGISIAAGTATDNAGNAAPAAGPSTTFMVDNTAPTGTIDINGSAIWTNDPNVTLALSSDDTPGSGVAQMRFRNEEAAWSEWETAGPSKTWILSTGDGAKTVEVQFNDTLGNISTGTIAATIGLDTAPPDAVISLTDLPVNQLPVLQFGVDFTESVAGTFTGADVTVVGTLSGLAVVTGADPHYTVTVTLTTPANDGTVGIALGSDIADPAGNPYPGATSGLYTIAHWPGFQTEPFDALMYTHDDLTLEVAVLPGPGTLTYQWKWDDGTKTIHDGPAAATWPLTDLAPANAGEYWCEVTYNAVTHPSAHAMLDVKDRILITLSPQSATEATGASHIFTVSATGGYEPLSYQWEKDEQPILLSPNAPSLELTNLDPSDSGRYMVEVRDANTDVQLSAEALLTVTAEQPVPAAGLLGLLALAGLLSAAGATKTRKK